MSFHPDVSGGIMIIGGTVTGGTVGSVLFVGAGGVLAQNNADFFYDDANNTLLVNNFSPLTTTSLVIGTATNNLVNLYLGKGATSTAPTANVFVSATSAVTTANTAGTRLYLSAGAGTGNATSGEVIIRTSDPVAPGSNPQSYTENMAWSPTNKATFAYGRVVETEGANVTAAATITLGTGNFFTVTGNTTIDNIVATNWNSAGPNVGGAQVTLLFTGTPTIRHNTAGTGARIFLAGSANLVAAANTILCLVWDGTQWQETSRKVA